MFIISAHSGPKAPPTPVPQPPQPVTSGDYCGFCTLLIAAAENFITENTTESEVEQFLDSLCMRFGGPYGTECADLMNMELPNVFEYIMNDESPQAVCTQIGMCSSAERLCASNMGCSICELIVQAAENFMTENTTETQIEHFLDKLCLRLGGTAGVLCAEIVNTEMPDLFEYIKNNESAQVACTQAGLCSSNGCLPEQEQEQEQEQQEGEEDNGNGQSQNCGICCFAASIVLNTLAQNTTQAQLEAQLVSMCGTLSAEVLAEECVDFVSTYLSDLIEEVVNTGNPSLVCDILGMCSDPNACASNVIVVPQ